MSDEFRGFTERTVPGMHVSLVLAEECRKYTSAIVRRLGPRVARAVGTVGRDTRGGRDYFYDQVEFFVRGRPDRSFIGFYHYGSATETPGSFFEVWDTEHDAEPVIRHTLQALMNSVHAAWEQGHLSDYLDKEVEAIRYELGF